MNFAFIDAIKVTTYVNFEFRLDFIMEMAKAATEPLNSFNSNLSNIMSAPALLSPGNVNLRGTIPKILILILGLQEWEIQQQEISLLKIRPLLLDLKLPQ